MTKWKKSPVQYKNWRSVFNGLNSDLWVTKIKASQYWQKLANITVTILGGASEKITISDLGGSPSVTTNSSGSVSYSLIKGTYTFTGSVSGQSFTRTVTSSTTKVYVMPEGALYWYGNECTWITGGWNKYTYNSGYNNAELTNNSQKQTNCLLTSCTHSTSGAGLNGFISNLKVNLSGYSMLSFAYLENTEKSGSCFVASTNSPQLDIDSGNVVTKNIYGTSCTDTGNQFIVDISSISIGYIVLSASTWQNKGTFNFKINSIVVST